MKILIKTLSVLLMGIAVFSVVVLFIGAPDYRRPNPKRYLVGYAYSTVDGAWGNGMTWVQLWHPAPELYTDLLAIQKYLREHCTAAVSGASYKAVVVTNVFEVKEIAL